MQDEEPVDGVGRIESCRQGRCPNCLRNWHQREVEHAVARPSAHSSDSAGNRLFLYFMEQHGNMNLSADSESKRSVDFRCQINATCGINYRPFSLSGGVRLVRRVAMVSLVHGVEAKGSKLQWSRWIPNRVVPSLP